MTVTVSAACTACGGCLITCPEAALSAAPGRPTVDPLRCTDCLACIEVCPVDAISSSTPAAHAAGPTVISRSASRRRAATVGPAARFR